MPSMTTFPSGIRIPIVCRVRFWLVWSGISSVLKTPKVPAIAWVVTLLALDGPFKD